MGKLCVIPAHMRMHVSRYGKCHDSAKAFPLFSLFDSCLPKTSDAKMYTCRCGGTFEMGWGFWRNSVVAQLQGRTLAEIPSDLERHQRATCHHINWNIPRQTTLTWNVHPFLLQSHVTRPPNALLPVVFFGNGSVVEVTPNFSEIMIEYSSLTPPKCDKKVRHAFLQLQHVNFPPLDSPPLD